MPFPFDNRYARLPEAFFARLEPTPVKEPRWIAFNRALAEELGLDAEALDSEEGLAFLSGNQVPSGAEPLAMAYAGHQFGGFVPQLGDGRALLLGEVVDRNGDRRDIQLKGSGPTPFSRRGDGRSALGPVIREYLLSEGMAALGVPTTRALAAIWTGESVWRENSEPGGIFTRVARSHLRIGTVQYFAARNDIGNLRQLVDHALERHDPDHTESDNPALSLLAGVCQRQANLVAQWMGLGFIHGVMNTDNMSLSGETIDYGPCAFLDAYDPAKKFSYIDHGGRYAFGNQPLIAQWNLARLAEALVPLLVEAADDDQEKALEEAGQVLEQFGHQFEEARETVFAAKLGFATDDADSRKLGDELLELMHAEEADFTRTFRSLSQALDPQATESFRTCFSDPGRVDPWIAAWRSRQADLGIDPKQAEARMLSSNPAIIPRNHRVEEAIQAANGEDFAPFRRLLEALTRPYEDREEFAEYEEPPKPGQEVCETFCGT
jgi:uncharacterized protein YdiU (UPF0061 family)